jgi:hypothetical protein
MPSPLLKLQLFMSYPGKVLMMVVIGGMMEYHDKILVDGIKTCMVSPKRDKQNCWTCEPYVKSTWKSR